MRLYVSGMTKPIFTDASGRFSVAVPGPGSYTVTPYPASSRLAAVPFRRTVDVAGSDISGIDFDFTRLDSRSALRGRVLNRAGVPQVGVQVYVGAVGGLETDANGIYGLSDIAPGRYSLTPLDDAMTFVPAVRIRNIAPGRAARISIRGTPLSAGPYVPTYLSGVFNSEIELTSGSCPILPPRVEGRAVVMQRDRSVRFYLPRLGFAKIDAVSTGFRGNFSKRKLGCTIEGDLNGEYSSPDAAAITGSLKVVCLGNTECEGSFGGALARQ
jgi:hypothetical protein